MILAVKKAGVYTGEFPSVVRITYKAKPEEQIRL